MGCENKYTIAIVSDSDYIDNTIICLESFYKYNDNHIDIHMVNSEKTDKFDVFENVSVFYHYYAIDSAIYKDNPYRSKLEEIIFKLIIMDNANTEYVCIFDTDTLFNGSISNALKEYDTHLNVVRQTLFDGINVGFLIYKKTNIKLFDSFIKTAIDGLLFDTLEEEFLYNVFKNDITFLDGSYNCSEILDKPKEDIKMYHYLGSFKPFKKEKYIEPSRCLIKYFDKYYDFCKESKYISNDFKNKINNIYKFYKFLKRMKYDRGC